MHRALGISEVVQRIVDEFIRLQPGFSLADEQKALAPLACVNILFSQYALTAIWRDAGIIPLRKLPGYPEWLGYPPASQESNEVCLLMITIELLNHPAGGNLISTRGNPETEGVNVSCTGTVGKHLQVL